MLVNSVNDSFFCDYVLSELNEHFLFPTRQSFWIIIINIVIIIIISMYKLLMDRNNELSKDQAISYLEDLFINVIAIFLHNRLHIITLTIYCITFCKCD